LQQHPGQRCSRCYRLPVRLESGLQPGAAGIPVGLPALAGIEVPAWGKVTRVGKETPS
jgi:NADH-quinone oxidoreductase subunit G